MGVAKQILSRDHYRNVAKRLDYGGRWQSPTNAAMQKNIRNIKIYWTNITRERDDKVVAHIDGLIETENLYPVLMWLTSSLNDWKMEITDGNISFSGNLITSEDIEDDDVFTDYDCRNFNRPFGCSWS